ncbi:hypothetical protein IV48_GL000118 [Fructilactobacillus fructivorans]|nr:hypothetical protein IV48_GL000118 [Fructilactobacillus fructivorans]
MGCGNIRYRYEIEKIRGMQTMAVKLNTQYGSIDIDNDVIATVVGGAATDNYGVVGMASKNQFKDNMNEILRKDSYSKGVVVREVNKKVQVDVNVIVSYGTKISEVSRNVQSKVKYNLESMLGINADSVNVIVQGIKVIND